MLHSYSCFYFMGARKKVALYSKSPFRVKIGSKFLLANLLMILPNPRRRTGSCTLQMKGRWESNMSGSHLCTAFPEGKLCTVHCASSLFPNRIIMFCFLIPTHIYLWEIYIFPDQCGLILGISKSLIDTWMWKLGLRPRNSQKRNT